MVKVSDYEAHQWNMEQIRVTVWNEFVHEQSNPEVRRIYPGGIHGVLAHALRADSELEVRTATLREPEHGLSKETLQKTDVLIWWGHAAHNEVDDAIAAGVQERVLEGMGLVVLHSGHLSKPFNPDISQPFEFAPLKTRFPSICAGVRRRYPASLIRRQCVRPLRPCFELCSAAHFF